MSMRYALPGCSSFVAWMAALMFFCICCCFCCSWYDDEWAGCACDVGAGNGFSVWLCGMKSDVFGCVCVVVSDGCWFVCCCVCCRS